MKALLGKGRTLDELWRVAEGKYKYAVSDTKWHDTHTVTGAGLRH